LLAHKPDLTAVDKGTGQTALALACAQGHEDIAAKVCSSQLFHCHLFFSGLTVTVIVACIQLIEMKADVNQVDASQSSIAHHAVRRNMDRVLGMLHKRKANFECRDGNGLTPLLLAVREGEVEIIRYLLSIKCDLAAKVCSIVHSRLEA